MVWQEETIDKIHFQYIAKRKRKMSQLINLSNLITRILKITDKNWHELNNKK